MLTLIKESLQPASITLLLSLLLIGVLCLYSGALARWGRRWLTALAIGYWTLSSPAGAGLLADTVTDGFGPLSSSAAAPGAQAVVMLSGGSRTVRAAGGRLAMPTPTTALRALETARVYRLLGTPLVILSGGVTDREARAVPESEAVRAAVIDLGVPAERIVLETESRNTREEALVLKRMLSERRIDRFVMVTSPVHMGRSLRAFAAEGMHPVPSAAPIYPDRERPPFPLLPNDAALEIGNAVIYEWAARAYYWWRGWT